MLPSGLAFATTGLAAEGRLVLAILRSLDLWFSTLANACIPRLDSRRFTFALRGFCSTYFANISPKLSCSFPPISLYRSIHLQRQTMPPKDQVAPDEITGQSALPSTSIYSGQVQFSLLTGPVSRIKKIIQLDEDIVQCSSNATFVIAMATVRPASPYLKIYSKTIADRPGNVHPIPHRTGPQRRQVRAKTAQEHSIQGSWFVCLVRLTRLWYWF